MAEKPGEKAESGGAADSGAGEGLPTPQDHLRANALDAAAEFDATGRHASSEAVDGWLARLEAGDEAAPPTSGRGEFAASLDAAVEEGQRARIRRQSAELAARLAKETTAAEFLADWDRIGADAVRGLESPGSERSIARQDGRCVPEEEAQRASFAASLDAAVEVGQREGFASAAEVEAEGKSMIAAARESMAEKQGEVTVEELRAFTVEELAALPRPVRVTSGGVQIAFLLPSAFSSLAEQMARGDARIGEPASQSDHPPAWPITWEAGWEPPAGSLDSCEWMVLFDLHKSLAAGWQPSEVKAWAVCPDGPEKGPHILVGGLPGTEILICRFDRRPACEIENPPSNVIARMASGRRHEP